MIRFSSGCVLTVSGLLMSLLLGCSTTGESEEAGAQRQSTANGTAQPQARASEEAAGTSAALAYPTGDQSTSTILLERYSPTEARIGAPYQYQIKVTNLTSAPLSGVVVREKLPADFTIASAEPTARAQAGEQVFDLGELPPKQSKTIRVNGTPGKEGSVDSCLMVSYSPALCTSTPVFNPMLKIVKQAPPSADLCEPITVKYLVTNVGTGTERNVRIEEKLPEGLTTEDGRNTISMDAGDLAKGMSKEATIRLKAARSGTFAGDAIAKGTGKEVRSEKVSTIVRAPKLEVALKGPEAGYVDKGATYQAIVTNVGDAPARNAAVKLEAGGQAELFAAPTENGTGGKENGARQADNATRTLGTLAPGESKTVDFNVRLMRPGETKLTALAGSECASPVQASISTNVGTLPALRLEVVDLEDAIRVGENVIYTINVKNQGTGDDEDIRIVATLPDEETFVKASGSTEASVEGKVITFAPVNSLSAGKSVEWRVEVKAARAGDVRFSVKMTSKSLTKSAEETEPTRLY